ncbi:MAG: efflux RND transporter permease subunit, partial [Chitinophagales bacterium]
IEVSLLSDKKEELESFKQELKDQLNTYVVLKDITDNDVDGRREIQIKLTDKAYILGFTHSEISRQIRQGFFGEEVQRLQKGTDEVRIWVRYPPEDRKNIGKMEQLKIKTLTGAEYPLTDLVTYDIGRSVVNINHLDGRREIKIEGDLTDQDEDLQAIITELETDVIPVLQEKYPSVRYELGGQAQGGQELGSSLSTALPLALIAVIILIALVFRSFSQAFMVLPMIFIAVGCAALGHGIEDVLQGDVDVPVSILSIYGIIALVGIIVNDTVIFLDKYNLLLREGYTVKKAAYDAGIARFRPILLTSITTVAGLYPIILETSSQAQFLKPMAISIAYGVLFGTFFILWFFPVLILAVNDLRRLITGVKDGAIPTAESVEPTVVEKKKLKELVR